MFGKLCKYELRYMMRIFLPMWALVLVLSIINRFTLFMDVSSRAGSLAQQLLMTALVFAAFALCVVSLIVVVQRFYNGLLKDEGYLMFTLPVKSGALINSKGLVAVLLMFITGIVGILIFVIIGTRFMNWENFSQEVRDFFEMSRRAGIGGGAWALMTIWGIVAMLMSTACSLYHIYTAMALGHLAKKHRVGWSVVAYIGISMAWNFLSGLAVSILAKMDLTSLERLLNRMFTSVETIPQGVILMEIVSIVVMGLVTALYFFITRYVLEHRLNLE